MQTKVKKWKRKGDKKMQTKVKNANESEGEKANEDEQMQTKVNK